MPRVRLKQLAQDGATDGQVITWNNANGVWDAQAVSIPVTQALATATASHVATTNTLITGMTVTPGAGDYKIEFSSSWELSTNNSSGELSIFVNGVQEAHSVRNTARPGAQTSGIQLGVATQAFVTGVLAAQAIEIRGLVSAGTLSIFQRSLIVTRVG